MLGKTLAIIATAVLMTAPALGQTIKGLEESIQTNPAPIDDRVRCFLDEQMLYGQNGRPGAQRIFDFALLANGTGVVNGFPVMPVDADMLGDSAVAMFALSDVVTDPRGRAQTTYLTDEEKQAFEAVAAFMTQAATGGLPRFVTIYFGDLTVKIATKLPDGQMGDITVQQCFSY